MNRKAVSSVLLPLLISVVCINCTNAAARGGGGKYQKSTCTEAGFFSYPDSCQEYLECRDLGGSLRATHRRCAEGAIFDDSISECKPKELVTSPPRCVQDGAGSANVSSLDAVDDGSPVDDPSVNATINPSKRIQVDNTTAVIDQDSPALVEGHGTENDTEASEDFGTDGPDVSGTSASLVNETNLTICDHMREINRYATLVVSNLFLERSFPDQMPYNVTQYNTDLETAQNNTALWRHGDSISILIKRTLYRVSEYKREFGRKLSINKDRIQHIAKEGTDQKLRDKLEINIKKKQVEINETEAVLASVSVNETALRQYIQDLFTSKEQEIKLMQQQMKFTSQSGRELKELFHFLESVRDSAPEVQDLFKHLQEQMSLFNAHLIGDNLAFYNYSNWVVEGIDVLTKEQENLRTTLSANKAQIERWEEDKEDLNVQKRNLTNKSWDILQEKTRLLDAMEVKMTKFRQETEKYCAHDESFELPTRGELDSVFTPILEKFKSFSDSTKNNKKLSSTLVKDTLDSGFNSVRNDYTIIATECENILKEKNLSLDLSEERDEMRELGPIDFKIINKILSQIVSSSQSIRKLSGDSPGLKRKIRQIDTELENIQRHNEDLAMLRDGANTSIKSLLEIINDCKVLQDKFESITSKLDDMMARGKAAESDDDIVRERSAIETSILDVQSQLKLLEVPEMETCHRL